MLSWQLAEEFSAAEGEKPTIRELEWGAPYGVTPLSAVLHADAAWDD